MKFNFFKKDTLHKKKIIKVIEKDLNVSLREEFRQLSKHNLTLPIRLYQL